MLAPSCLNRPIAECLTGVEWGSHGSTSTTYPKRLTSLGSAARSKRSSNRSHLRPDGEALMP